MTEIEYKLARDKIPELLDLLKQSFEECQGAIPEAVKFIQEAPVDDIQCEPIGLEDGLVNFLYRVSRGDQSVVVKWARLTPRMAEIHDVGFNEGEQRRNVIECRALRLIERAVPGSTPNIYWSDSKRFFFIMQDLSQFKTLRHMLHQGHVAPEAFRSIAAILSGLHMATHVQNLPSEEFDSLVKEFDTELNRLAVAWMCDTSFTSGGPSAATRRRTVELDRLLPEIIDNPRVAEINQRLGRALRRDKICFTHGDTHGGCVMVGTAERGGNVVKVIDPEFANMSTPSKDVGSLLGDVIMSYYVSEGRRRSDVCEQIKDCVRITLRDYLEQMEALIPDVAEFMHYVAVYAGHFAAITLVNMMPHPPFDELPVSEATCARAAIRLMKEMDTVCTVEDFIGKAFGQ